MSLSHKCWNCGHKYNLTYSSQMGVLWDNCPDCGANEEDNPIHHIDDFDTQIQPEELGIHQFSQDDIDRISESLREDDTPDPPF